MWRHLAGFVLAALVALAAALAVVVGTEQGTVWLAREAQAWSAGTLRLDGVQGTLAGGLRARNLQLRVGDTTVHGEAIELRLRARALLGRRLVIEHLGAARIGLELPPDEPSASSPFRMPTIAAPLPVVIDDLHIGLLRLGADESAPAFQAFRFQGELTGTHLTVREASGTIGAVSIRLAGEAELRDPLPLDARVQWRLAEPAVSGAGTVRGELAALDLRQWLNLPEPVTISGRLKGLVDAPRVDAVADWDALTLQVPGIGSLRASGGRADLSGWLDDWQAQLAADLRAPDLPAARGRASLHGNDRVVHFDDVRLDGSFGALAAQGEFLPGPAPRLRLTMSATEVSTAAFRPGLDGRLSTKADLDAEFPGALRLRLRQLDGRLMGRPLAGGGEVEYESGRWRFRKVSLDAGRNRLRADGELGERLAGTFSLNAPELSVLWPGLGGSASARAKVAGTLARPVVELDATGSALALDGNRVRALGFRGSVDRTGRANARLDARGIEAGGRVLGDLAATLDGTLTAHRFSAQLRGGPADVRLDSSGRWDGRALRHRVASASAKVEPLGEWYLAGEPELSVGADAVTAGAHCWQQAPAELCVSQLGWSPGEVRVAGTLRDFDLARFERWLPQDLALSGRAGIDAALDVAPAGMAGALTARFDEAVVYYTGGDEPLVTPLRTAQLTARFGPQEATMAVELAGDSGLRVTASGRMLAPLGARAALEVELQGELPDISPLVPLLAPDLDLAEVEGEVKMNAAVSGSLQSPQWTGVVRLTRAAVALPDVGVKFTDIDVALLGDGSDVVRVQGSAKAGGPLTLAGQLSPLDPAGPQGWLRVRGNGIDAVRLPDRYVKASPDFTVRYEGGRISADGSISIPKADIVVRELPESAASPSPDATVHDRPAPDPTRPPPATIGGEIALVLGRDVRLRGFGLDTRLEGTVKLSQGDDGEPRGFGVLRLKEGRFGAYGRELSIDRGTLGFTGPLDDPAVDLRASRQVDWEGRRVKAGLLLTGTALRPQSRVFAEPAMSEADALSYLISGRPLQSANQNERSSIAGAALALGVQQTSPLTGRIGSAVTLDELGVEGGTLDETEVVAGKQLGSDLYVRFAYGVFSRIGTVLARYRIGRNVSIEAASGEDQSLDLIYSVERE